MSTSTRQANRLPVSRSASTQGPRQLGAWDLVGLAAEGSLAQVYRARPVNSRDDLPAGYAVKVLHDRWNGDPRAVAMFRREAELGRTIAHCHLVSVLAAQLTEPPYYLVMPWLEGQTLRRLLNDAGPPDLPTALWIARQAAEALAALAAAGWRHGDLKPENLFVSRDMHVTVLDLGLARRVDEPDSVLDRCVAGTCRYVAPEAITSTLAADVRSDIYSLGAVLFEMLAGRPPVPGDTVEAILRAHREGPPPDVRRLAPQLPDGVIRLLRQTLSKEPLRRPQTPDDLVERLARLEVLSFTERAFC